LVVQNYEERTMSNQLLSTGDVARRLDVSSEFIRKLAREGKLPTMRTAGGQRIFRSEDVERLAKALGKQLKG
jgi:excisionase family DNA binding protein